MDFAYKSGESSVVKIKWNDKSGELEIGKREGKFDGMNKAIPLKITLVNGSEVNKTISLVYKGKKMIEKLNK